MNVCVVGSGYVGLVTGSCLAEMGNRVWCVDRNQSKIEKLRQGVIPIYEPGLEELVRRNVQEKRLFFSAMLQDGLAEATVCIIAVGTPPLDDGSADLADVLAVAKEIGVYIHKYLLVVTKSTVPVGTARQIKSVILEQLVQQKKAVDFDVVSNPEFLKEGAAIEDFMEPDRIVIGVDSQRPVEILRQLYEPLINTQQSLVLMDTVSAELTKYAANAMLATRISFMNEIARLCDQVGADVAQVRVGMGMDSRIGMPFLHAGPGYGGSCFPKDVKELIQAGERHGSPMQLLQAVDEVNEQQKKYLVNLVVRRFSEDLSGFHFALWGLAFKPQTDDVRESPALVLIRELLSRGASITAYDPAALEPAKIMLGPVDRLFYVSDMLEALPGKDALILLTEWRQFRQMEWTLLGDLLKRKIVFDGRNIYDPIAAKAAGFEYYCIGRGCILGDYVNGSVKE
ncbi:UDP-glucose/GDP-mannose dehydrogenase family protein [Anaeromusa sp.]|uniref:UDP-glucose dehydrogenase family protein n=1 Tax=Anaeromusa sp. TaxID=1872520 RepID=UPI00263361FE|nr:UDP-glucose/GDP-mannose dehydrogenase family protein [Anaeromusa sp.]MDD3157098.1 UDP-glucose/GDP-mannose dehydrogenase family protein [Anaeromusa sp.]